VKEQPVIVTVDNFVRAETDTYFASMIAEGELGSFEHKRELTPVDRQIVVRSNRDTLYSNAVVDLDAGPATVRLPDAKGRFMSLLAINEDHYVLRTIYEQGSHRFTRDDAGTRYLFLLIRTFVDPRDAADLKTAHALQAAIEISQSRRGSFEIPDWDEVSLKQTRKALQRLPGMNPSKAFGGPGDVDPVHHLMGAARGWGGNPAKDAVYLACQVAANDGATVHRLIVSDVPVDGFWSVSVYNQDGFFEPNPQNAYSINNVTASKAADGSTAIQFGGCSGSVDNCLPISPGWTYTVRLYRPRPEILSGAWRFPEATPT
jgi:hypothetical protein